MKRPQFFFEADGGGGTGGSGGAGGAATLLGGAGGDGGAGAGQQAAAPAWTWAGEDGKFSEGWQDKLPDDIKGHASLKVLGTVQDLAKSYVHTKGMIGTKLEMPGEGATPEAVAHWRKVVGAPEKPEGYRGEAKSLRPESVPENLWDAKAEEGFLALAHKHHLPPAAVKEILGYHAQHIQGALTQSQEQEQAILTQEAATLKQEWGENYQANLNIAARAAATLGLKTDDPIFSKASYVKAMVNLSKLISEDKLVKGDAATSLGGSIAERIRDITDPTSTSQLGRAYRGDFGPQQQAEAQKQLHALYNAQQK